MSRDIIVLTPNGRRVKVHCVADTSILQVLEDVCTKQGINSNDYDLKHHKKILDLTTTIRFCNLPNKAFLELVEAEKKRVESNVTVGLMLNDGERKTGDFSPSTSLYDLITTLAPNELPTLQNPSISYMRQEVTGLSALKEKSLRQLGLITGRAILRLLDKSEAMQANVSAVYGFKKTDKAVNDSEICEKQKISDKEEKPHISEEPSPGPSHNVNQNKTPTFLNPVKLLIHEKKQKEKMDVDLSEAEPDKIDHNDEIEKLSESSKATTSHEPPKPVLTQEILERRLKIEEEVTFIGSQKAVAFMQPEGNEEELPDLPDDFYDLTVEEVRKIYHELQQRRVELENTPMLTSSKKEEFAQQASLSKLETYKNVVVRIQFPDNIILQGIFTPSNTLEDVQNFVKEHLNDQNKPFHIFTTPLKETINPKTTLLEAKFVPCVHMHFKWLNDSTGPYLKEEIYFKRTSSDAAGILASKYRAPSRRKLDNSSTSNNSSTQQGKIPKWFKK